MFTLEYFIKKFADLPEDYMGLTTEDTDAWMWCSTEEADALAKIVKPFGLLIDVNDGIDSGKGYGDTPKQRVLRFLNHIADVKVQFYYE